MLLIEGSKEKKKSGMSLSRFHFRFYQFRGLLHRSVMKSIPAARNKGYPAGFRIGHGV